MARRSFSKDECPPELAYLARRTWPALLPPVMPDLIRHPDARGFDRNWIPDQVRNDKTANSEYLSIKELIVS
jgi:hypothetical protein